MAKVKKAKVVHPEAKGLLILGGFTLLLISLLTFSDGIIETNWLGITGYYVALSFNALFGLGSFIITACGFWYGIKLLTKKSVDSLKLKSLYFFIFLLSLCFIFNTLSEMHLIGGEWIQNHSISESYTVNKVFNHRTIRYNLGGIPLYYLYRDLPAINLQSLLSDLGVLCTFGIISIVSGILFFEVSVLQGVHLAKKGALSIWEITKKGVVKLKKVELKEALFETSSENALVPISLRKKEHKKITTPELKVKANDNPIPPRVDRSQIVDVENVKIHRDKKPKLNLEENFNAPKSKPKHRRAYDFPPLSLLTNAKKIDHPSLEKELKSQATILEETLLSFGIEAKVGEINCGPTITSFEVHPAIGVKVQKIKGVENDIALNMQARSIRIIAPIPGKAVVGVEVPSLYPQEVGFKEMLYHYSTSKQKLNIPVVLGKTVSGEDVMCDLTKMPHCIIAGATGSGKSVCVNTIIMSMLMTMSPDDVKLILIDPKKVELTPFSDIPHLIAPVITEPQGAHAALTWVVREMQTRYDILKRLSLRNITAFNEREVNEAEESELDIDIPEKMHWIVMIIDEFADLMMTSDEDLETPIARIAQMARAVGIHMILATQRPSREVITGLIKANFPSRISFKVASRVNSQIIIDESGAEMLLGNGDMLFVPPTASQPIRAQGAFIRDEDINRVIRFIKDQRAAEYVVDSFDTFMGSNMKNDDDDDYKDTLFPQAVEIVMSTKTASTTFLQRKLKVGYARAASLIDELEDHGIIGPQDGSRPRKILAQAESLSGYPDGDLLDE
ncbi:MAG: DNA translocase FtsK 4TM domain-containing protein [Rhabdochlamydiaceae bacterium]|nr:DNA translocase FtsK 4TM domain-containing protein [Candidatus Amphrikana amoebophyrae]